MKKIDTGLLLQKKILDNWDTEFLIDAINHRYYSYSAFFSMVLRCKEKLEGQLKENDIICVIMNNSVEVIALYFAALFLKIPIIAIDPNKGKEEIREILSCTSHKMLISNIEDFNLVTDKIDFDNFFKDLHLQKKEDIDKLGIFLKVDYEHLFIITYTSGSTGKSKGVMHSFNNFVLSSLAFKERFKFNSKNIFYHNLPMSYIGGILNLIILPLVSGSKIVVDKKFDISQISNFWETPIKYSVNTFWFIPTILSLLLKLDRSSDGIEYAKNNHITGLVGTAPLRKDLKEKFQEIYQIPLFESYGLSETFFIATNYPGCDKSESPGKLLEDVEITFSDQGEILMKVPWMFLGYHGLDNDEYFQNGAYLSGDLGEFDSDDFLKITGRKKDLIIKGGLNLSPKRIEDFIIRNEIFEECLVIGADDSILGEKIVCMYVSHNKIESKSLKDLNNKIVVELGIDSHIDEFLKINNIPKNLNGKIDRPKAKKIYQNLKR